MLLLLLLLSLHFIPFHFIWLMFILLFRCASFSNDEQQRLLTFFTPQYYLSLCIYTVRIKCLYYYRRVVCILGSFRSRCAVFVCVCALFPSQTFVSVLIEWVLHLSRFISLFPIFQFVLLILPSFSQLPLSTPLRKVSLFQLYAHRDGNWKFTMKPAISILKQSWWTTIVSSCLQKIAKE